MHQEESDPEESTPRRFDVELFIVHPTLDPAEITAALGLEGHHTQRVGDGRQTPKGTLLSGKHPDMRWRHSVRYEIGDQWFAEAVTKLVDRLVPHKAFLGSLRSTSGEICVIIQFLGDGHFGDKLPSDTLAKLVDMGLDLGIECFDVPQS